MFRWNCKSGNQDNVNSKQEFQYKKIETFKYNFETR